ncbi:MAG: hypothetical protein A2X40_09455 [Elusimicrobia bacterium GWC2_65_9]|nr:MAG: hypothetical protein A2X37_00910 [Elusimicrobia bacterium GWA2_66_18]OGR70490.1 MAG: hypothetical protein A2X40_09455 [Elusimicrobia bacterium GWC2_65_9]
MNLTALALFACLAAPVGAAPDVKDYAKLPPGRYSIEIQGMLSTICARAISAQWSTIPEVEKAAVDFDKGLAVVTIRIDKTLKVSVLRKALKQAERTANLGATYDLRDIHYLPYL